MRSSAGWSPPASRRPWSGSSAPAGSSPRRAEVKDGRAGRVGFASVPAFAFARDAVVVADGLGPVTLDVGYGGAFYGVLAAAELGLDLEASPLGRIVEAARAAESGGGRPTAL